MKIRITISIAEDTDKRLRTYAEEHHMNISQAVTDLVWNCRLRAEPMNESTANWKDSTPNTVRYF